jgi:hypothetical protein
MRCCISALGDSGHLGHKRIMEMLKQYPWKIWPPKEYKWIHKMLKKCPQGF